jgi:predicted metallo-beta-lactamase superfamily hydrolase
MTMVEVADLLRIEGPPGARRQQRRVEAATRALRRIEKRTGMTLLVDVGYGRWLTTRSMMEEAIPALAARAKSEAAALSILRKKVESLEQWRRTFS